MQAPKTLLIAFLVLGGLLTITPTAQAQVTSIEDFEDELVFSSPESDFYTYLPSSSETGYVTDTQALAGTQSFRVNDGGERQLFQFDQPLCAMDSFSFAFRIAATATVPVFFGFTDSANGILGNTANPMAGIHVASLSSVRLVFNKPPPQTTDQTVVLSGLTLSTDTWYNVTIAMVPDPTMGDPCAATTTGQEIRFVGSFPDQAIGGFLDVNHPIPATTSINRFNVAETSSDFSNGPIFLDNIEVQAAAATVSSNWCSNPFSLDYNGDPDADFGYNYVEGASFSDDLDDEFLSGSGLVDGYLFQSTSDNYDYMGKGWTTDVQAAKSIFRIEADAEGRSTDFRSVFSFETDTPSSTSKGAGATAGDTSGSFATHIAARFRESGNDWLVSLEFNNDALDDGSPVQLGGSAVVGNPNSPETYSLTVDTRGTGYAAIKNSAGVDIRNQTMQGNSNTDFASLQGLPFYSQWFVSGGSNSLLISQTALDDNLDSGDTDDSTCIFFLENIEVVVTGDQGTLPGSLTPGDPVEPGEGDLGPGSIGSVFANITDAGTQIFMGFLLVFGVVWMGIRQNAGFAAIGALFIIGLILSYGAGLTPLWVLILVFVLSLAAVWFLPKPNAGGI